jgi:alpha-glucosidase
MDLLTKIRGLTYLGWGTLWRSLTFSLRRDRIERKAGLHLAPPEPARVGKVGSAVRTAGGALFRLDQAELEVAFLAPDLARLTWTPGSLPVPYAIARTDWPPVEPAWTEGGSSWTLATPEMSVTVHRDGSARLADGPGRVLRDFLPPERRGEGWVLRGRLADGERCHGLGLRSAPFDLRGGTYRLWNLEAKGSYGPASDPLYVSVPVWLGVRPDGASLLTFVESSWHGRATFEEEAVFDLDGGALRFYAIPGPPARAIERYAQLTGLPAMPPRWALGHHQARWSYMDEAEVREVADGFATHGLPLSAIHLDIHYMDGHRVFTVDPARFPDLAGLCRDLETRGVRVVTILDPGVKVDEGYDVYRSGRDGGHFLKEPDGSEARAQVWPGTSAFPDFTDPVARDWWGGLYRVLLDAGVAGVWHDMNEPAAFAAWGDCTLPRTVRHSMEGRGGDHREGHNVYGMLEGRAGYEGLARLRPDRRPWILSRSGFAGQQRWAWNWTGDSESNWWSLRQSLRIALSLSMSGIPYTGPDIGGFGGNPPPELFARWFELAAFLPFFRTHSAWFTPRREPWRWDDATSAILAAHLRLRHRLLPYWYTLAAEASRTGRPLVRPMFWPDAADPALLGVEDQFLLGDALLVAPVLEEGARSRDVVLPAGRWHALVGDAFVEGPGALRVEAPLDVIPVWARAGSVVPMDDDGRLVLHVFVPEVEALPRGVPPSAADQPELPRGVPPSAWAGEVYSDDGDGYGPSRIDRFSVTRDGDALEISRRGEGDYPCPAFSIRIRGAGAREALVDGRPVAIAANAFDAGEFGRVRVTLQRQR